MDAEEKEVFMEDLYAQQDAQGTAKQMLREHMKAQGVDWDEDI